MAVSEKIKKITSQIQANNLSSFGKEFQSKLLKMIILDKAYALKTIPLLKSEYFSDIYIRTIYDYTKKYINKYMQTPSFDNLKIIIANEVEKPKPYEILLDNLSELSVEDWKFVEDNTYNFCFKKHALGKLEMITKKVENLDFISAKEMVYETFSYEKDNTTTIFYSKKGIPELYDENKVISPLPTIFPTFNKNMQGGPGEGKLVILVAGSNFGKCFGKGTKIRMYDKSLKNIEDIVDGDLVMGYDGLPRTVEGTTTGVEELFKVKQKHGIDYVVNKSHILALVNKDRQILTLDVNSYLQLHKETTNEYYGFKSFVDYNQNDLLEHTSEIELEPLGEGEYFGFSIKEENKLFLLEDFTVVHNTNALVATARKLNEVGKNVVLFSFEIGGVEIFRRHYAGLVDEVQENVKYSRVKIENKVNNEDFGEFILVEEKATKARMSTIEQNLNYIKSQGIKIDAILIDGLNQLKLPEGMRYEGDNRMFEYLAEEMRDLAKTEKVPIYTVFQGNRCLAPNTIVNIKGKGNIEIKDVEVGDFIEAPNGYKRVEDKWENEKQPMYKITLKNGKEIICSEKHQFETDRALLSIQNGLEVGSQLGTKIGKQDSCLFDFYFSEIISIEKDIEQTSIDITVEEELFFANGILTHNSSFKNEINDEQSIGKAIEPLQVSDALIFFSQTAEMARRGVCIANLIKNRMGRKGIILECAYDPDKCTFTEISEFNPNLNITHEQAGKAAQNGQQFLSKYNIQKK